MSVSGSHLISVTGAIGALAWAAFGDRQALGGELDGDTIVSHELDSIRSKLRRVNSMG